MVARKNWTRQWWKDHMQYYEVVTSDAVIDELNHGDYPNKNRTIELASRICILPIEDEISEIVRIYIDNKLMPNNPLGDALHLAISSFYKCDFLLTWNCVHLANANKFAHIRRINTLLGLFVPVLLTTLEFLGDPKYAE